MSLKQNLSNLSQTILEEKPRKETFCFKKNLNKNGKNGQRDSTLHCVLLYTYIHQKHVDHSIRSIPIILPTSET